ncbi:hypothetical protein PV04_08380 [Phialophora macrospora]|uniref:Uncharacterized protein n=1 Tax=Phialophora macrospora TaxID=1851006 RepID=A0A0D2G244_9EURO|nr:hypothetical protein PV04_08380 [Phialophora macrospora]
MQQRVPSPARLVYDICAQKSLPTLDKRQQSTIRDRLAQTLHEHDSRDVSGREGIRPWPTQQIQLLQWQTGPKHRIVRRRQPEEADTRPPVNRHIRFRLPNEGWRRCTLRNGSFTRPHFDSSRPGSGSGWRFLSTSTQPQGWHESRANIKVTKWIEHLRGQGFDADARQLQLINFREKRPPPVFKRETKNSIEASTRPNDNAKSILTPSSESQQLVTGRR